MDITKLKGHIPDSVYGQLPDTIAKSKIDSALKLAHFISQCAHESGNFSVTKENLNYSEEGLLKIFKHDFDINHDGKYSDNEEKKAEILAKKPEQIANFVYANQNGNGNEVSGDGYKFCGRGYIQLTGRSNYAAFDKQVEEDLLTSPGLVATKYPLMSAAFFFDKNKLWDICSQGSTKEVITRLTKRINGGVLGLNERIEFFNKFYNLLK